MENDAAKPYSWLCNLRAAAIKHLSLSLGACAGHPTTAFKMGAGLDDKNISVMWCKKLKEVTFVHAILHLNCTIVLKYKTCHTCVQRHWSLSQMKPTCCLAGLPLHALCPYFAAAGPSLPAELLYLSALGPLGIQLHAACDLLADASPQSGRAAFAQQLHFRVMRGSI
eukprot:1162126-Pelagomonas_calceolata.AAC.4